MLTDLVVMGNIVDAFGVHGWNKIKVNAKSADTLAKYGKLYIRYKDSTWQLKKIEKSFAKENVFHAKLEGIEDRDMALSLKGYEISIPRNSFPSLEQDEFYWVDLIGLSVLNQQNEYLGTVTSLLDTGANSILVVNLIDEERLIPFVAQYIIDVNFADKKIIVDWGMDY